MAHLLPPQIYEKMVAQNPLCLALQAHSEAAQAACRVTKTLAFLTEKSTCSAYVRTAAEYKTGARENPTPALVTQTMSLR